jgi:hypothetical protein
MKKIFFACALTLGASSANAQAPFKVNGLISTGPITAPSSVFGGNGNAFQFIPGAALTDVSYLRWAGTGQFSLGPPIGGLIVEGTNAYTNSSPSAAFFGVGINASGSPPSGAHVFSTNSCNDAVNFTANGGALAGGACFDITHTFSGGATGQRAALSSLFNVSGIPLTSVGGGFLLGASLQFSSAYNLGGTAGTKSGNVASFSYQTTLNNGATHYNLAEGWEGGITIDVGASVNYVNGAKITVSGCGAITCNGLVLGGSTGTQMAIGISFGSGETPVFPVAPTGTLIGSQAYNGGNVRSATYGVDLSGVTISTGAFKSTGFLVDGSGNVTGASYKAGAAVGVSCAAGTVSLATLVVTGGIVTHC